MGTAGCLNIEAMGGRKECAATGGAGGRGEQQRAASNALIPRGYDRPSIAEEPEDRVASPLRCSRGSEPQQPATLHGPRKRQLQ